MKRFCALLFCMLYVTDVVLGATCPTGYSTLASGKHIDTTYKTFSLATFISPINGVCMTEGYIIKDIPDDILVLNDGGTNQTTNQLCTNGYLVNNSSCTTYTQGDCPEDYINMGLNTNTFTTLTEGVCASGYSKYTINQQCNSNTTDSMCAMLCSEGLEYTDIGTCAQICTAEYTTMRTSTGLIYPMYSTKQITPSINVGRGNDVCYVNLLPGNADNAINIKYENQVYHAVK